MTITLLTWNINGIRSVFKPTTPDPINSTKSSDPINISKKRPFDKIKFIGNDADHEEGKEKKKEKNIPSLPSSFSDFILCDGVKPTSPYSPRSLVKFIAEWDIDILCFQETKVSDLHQVNYLLHVPSFDSFYSFCTQPKGYSGVATYLRQGCTRSTQTNFVNPTLELTPSSSFLKNLEGRVMVTELHDFTLLNLYCPNGGRNLEYKFQFYQCLLDYVRALIDQGKAIIICGDLNIVHHPIDAWNAKVQ